MSLGQILFFTSSETPSLIEMSLGILEWSINYDSKGESTSHGKGKEKGFSVLNEA